MIELPVILIVGLLFIGFYSMRISFYSGKAEGLEAARQIILRERDTNYDSKEHERSRTHP